MCVYIFFFGRHKNTTPALNGCFLEGCLDVSISFLRGNVWEDWGKRFTAWIKNVGFLEPGKIWKLRSLLSMVVSGSPKRW